MNTRKSANKIANNILEFMIDPTVIPVEKRLYFNPEEILDNRIYEEAKKKDFETYGDQSHNSDSYPQRNKMIPKEGSVMDRRTIIASMDILSKSFTENDPISKDLKTMAYAMSKMSAEELEQRLVKDAAEEKSAGNPWMDHMKKVRKDNPGKSLKELIGIAKKTYKKTASEEEVKQAKDFLEAEDEAKEEAAKEEVKEAADFWSKEASEAVAAAIVTDVKGPIKEAACKDEEKVPEKDKTEVEATEEVKETEEEAPKEVEATEEAPKEVEATEEAPKEVKATEEAPKEVKAKKEKKEEVEVEEVVETPAEVDEVEASVVNTDKLALDFDGIEMNTAMITPDDIGELTATEKTKLDQLFN